MPYGADTRTRQTAGPQDRRTAGPQDKSGRLWGKGLQVPCPTAMFHVKPTPFGEEAPFIRRTVTAARRPRERAVHVFDPR
ncbi:hypothetical protein GCM10017557_42200 [Streptomyces aurantiacus]|uniref:Uncharacterized protein n=1 Tax=Streptomyces aurantiacus TaxID=47760 RepID=A0A7G1P3W1_9ACTN|nr:hypothetical protein GCM10017557_42200 [Streptomyces aurantiacus]